MEQELSGVDTSNSFVKNLHEHVMDMIKVSTSYFLVDVVI